METDDDIAEPVLAPLVASCRALGLKVENPVVLGARANVVVHLSPSPVVARVATLTDEVRNGSFEYLRREREIGRALADRGLRVIAPTTLVDPGPHSLGDRSFLLLGHQLLRSVDLGSIDHAIAAGRAFAEVTRGLSELPAELGTGDEGQPWGEIENLMATVAPSTANAVMSEIQQALSDLRASEPDDPWQLVHGDAHKANVALNEQGAVVWFDFEDANRRPLAWDLATLCRAWPAAGEEACRILDVDRSSPSMRWHHELRELYALLWSQLYDSRFEETRAAGADRLYHWLTLRQQ